MNYIGYQQVKKIQQHLKNGGVIAYATESCYGFGCDPFNYNAINKLLKIKQRPKTKGMIVISGNKKILTRIVACDLNNPEFDRYWPGSYSIILPTKDVVPKNLVGKHTKIAVRLTKHKQIIQLSQYLHIPLVSTSANKSGMKAIKNYRECVNKFGKQVMVIKGITNFAKRPSTIIDWETKNILRG